MSLKVLFIGGTGNISLPCVAQAVAAGHRVSVFNRGATGAELPPSVTSILSDRSDAATYRELGALIDAQHGQREQGQEAARRPI